MENRTANWTGFALNSQLPTECSRLRRRRCREAGRGVKPLLQLRSTCEQAAYVARRSRSYELQTYKDAVRAEQKKDGGRGQPSMTAYADVRLLLFLCALGGHRFESEPEQLAHTRVFLASVALERCALIGGDAHRDLP